MKLLFDEHFPRKLVARFSELDPGSAHVTEFDWLERPDRQIWASRTQGFTVVSTDADSYELAAALGPPHKGVFCQQVQIWFWR